MVPFGPCRRRRPGTRTSFGRPSNGPVAKRWQLRELEPLWAAHQRRPLVEPFCGGLAVALGLMPATALLNDINPHVINFYGWLRRGLTISFAMLNDEAQYYRCRDRFNDLLLAGEKHTEEAAGLFYYLNRTGYNGLCPSCYVAICSYTSPNDVHWYS